MVSNVVATTRPTCPRPSRCSASKAEKVRLASPRTSASAMESINSNRLNLLSVKSPGLSGRASSVFSLSSTTWAAASSSSSRIGRLPSYSRITYLRLLWLADRRRDTSSAWRLHLRFQASKMLTASLEHSLSSLARRNFSFTCSAKDFGSRPLTRGGFAMGFHEVLATASTSAISAVCMTYLTAGSQCSLQRSISSCRGPSKGSSRRLFASGSSD
mmetsp:Transcript_29477/g.69546  ORF Transcript_29477/g.69546 Transcript_29477/m.69546 type:complete len:215 (-) Transcript_29477:514-1158(-)